MNECCGGCLVLQKFLPTALSFSNRRTVHSPVCSFIYNSKQDRWWVNLCYTYNMCESDRVQPPSKTHLQSEERFTSLLHISFSWCQLRATEGGVPLSRFSRFSLVYNKLSFWEVDTHIHTFILTKRRSSSCPPTGERKLDFTSRSLKFTQRAKWRRTRR